MNWRKGVIFLWFFLTKNKIPIYLNEIKKIEKHSPAEIKKYQERKLKKLLIHAHKNVPYYRKIFTDLEVVIDGNVFLDNFNKVPILTKEIIRKEFNNLKSKDISRRRWYYNTSGGSTGEPVRYIQDKEYYQWNIANKIYLKSFGGQDMGDREMRLWGSERDILEGQEKLSARFKNWLYNRKELNSFRMSENGMFEFIEEWNRFKPSWVEAYTQAIYEFGKFIERNKLTITSPRGIVSTAGTLYPEMRKSIEAVFACKVYNRYGSREVGDMACNCEKQETLHLSIWNHYLEILDSKLTPSKHGELGKIYITSLNNMAMPMIRYDIGDFAVPTSQTKCSCGRNTPLIDRVEGREMSMFKTRDGRYIPGEFFIHFIGVVFNKGFIKKFQAIQKSYDSIIIKVVLSDKHEFEQQKSGIENSIKEVMGKRVKVRWEYVDEIKPTGSGKFVYTICDIK